MLQTTIYRKQTDQQHCLDARSEHLKLLKDSIPYSQALTIKRIFSSQQELVSHTAKMINHIQKHGSLIEQQIDKANLHEREQLFLKKRKKLPQIIRYR